MNASSHREPIRIFLIEDNPGDVELTKEALADSKILNELSVATDGGKALERLRSDAVAKTLPDLILLDLNLPGLNGRQVLAEIKSNLALKRIPVIILTSSQAESDIAASYDLHANCFITKPIEFTQFMKVVRTIENFWFSIVRLPDKDTP